MEKSYMGGDSDIKETKQTISTITSIINPPVKQTIVNNQVQGKSSLPVNIPVPQLKKELEPPKIQIISKPVPKQSVVKPPEVKPTPPQIQSKGGVPPVPKGIPAVPKVTAFKAPVSVQKPMPQPQAKSTGKELTLMEQIQQGVSLKKVQTVEKTALDYLKKKSTVSSANKQPINNSESNDSSQQTTTQPTSKGNLFDEMRKVQLKKIVK